MVTENIHINDLPLETFEEILKHIDGSSLGRCRRVCKQWKENIDGLDHLWQEMCRKEFKYSSKIAKQKSGNDCRWYYIFKNLKQWSDLTNFDKNIKEFYKFTIHDKSHILDIDYGVLPLRDSKGISLYDTHTFKYIPVAVPNRNCYKIVNNDYVTIIQIKSGVLIERSVDCANFATEEYFRADNFVLAKDILYFYFDKDVYKCDLRCQMLEQVLILKSQYFLMDIQHSDGKLYLFTDNGQIININKNNETNIEPLKCPIEWVRHFKHIRAVNNRNFVLYSRSIFKIETDRYQHLYLEFPPITALFFYVDVVIIGTRNSEILLYRLSSQKKGARPIFETLATLPDGKYAVQLDVCERRSGPTIVISTFFELYLLDINFFPHEQIGRLPFTIEKQLMYKRLFKLKRRIHLP